MLIIPAIDIIENKIVRLTKGDFQQVQSYKVSLFNQIEKYLEAGFNHIHIIDLYASKDDNITTLNLLREIKQRFEVRIEFGGGIRNENNVKSLLDLGVDILIIGSLSVTNKSLFEKIIASYHPENFIIATDVLNHSIMIKGWKVNSQINIYDHINYCKQLGLKKFLCTDIEKDGMMCGLNINLYNEIKEKNPDIFLIASGGVSGIEDIIKLMQINTDACVIGKAIYEGKIDLKELKKFDN